MFDNCILIRWRKFFKYFPQKWTAKSKSTYYFAESLRRILDFNIISSSTLEGIVDRHIAFLAYYSVPFFFALDICSASLSGVWSHCNKVCRAIAYIGHIKLLWLLSDVCSPFLVNYCSKSFPFQKALVNLWKNSSF